MPGSGGDGGVLPDYFRVPVGASWRTRLIGRFPEIGKPWNRAENDHVRLSCEVRMMMAVMSQVSHGLETGHCCLIAGNGAAGPWTGHGR